MSVDAFSASARGGFLSDLILDAGAKARRYFDGAADLEVHYKEPRSEVSVADREVENFIRRRIAERFPEDACFGEEYGMQSGNENTVYWVIDPIDGTHNFLRSHYDWCVSIAVATRREILAGAVFNPSTSELFFAEKEKGAFLNGKPLRCASDPVFSNSRLAIGYKPSVDRERYLRIVRSTIEAGGAIYYNGSGALMCCFAAASRLGAFVELHINAWDCLAGILIAREAGCLVNDFYAGDGFRHGNFLLIASPSLWDEAARIAEFQGPPLRRS